MTVVLDASALLALLNREQGAERVAAAVVAGAVIGAVNLSEVAAKLSDWGVPDAEVREVLGGLGLRVAPFDTEVALLAAALRPATRERGLSLGDRACLALGLREDATVLTADRSWKGLVPDVTLAWLR